MEIRTAEHTAVHVDVLARSALEPGSLAGIADVDAWVLNRIAAPHPELGRTGDVCPFVAAALRRDSLRYALVAGDELTDWDVVSVVSSLGATFDALRAEATRPELETMVIVFFEMGADVLTDLVLRVHRACKDAFVRAGRMLGEFLPGYEARGIHNPDFRPLTAPVPLLVIRSMVAGDSLFLQDHPEWLDIHACARKRRAS